MLVAREGEGVGDSCGQRVVIRIRHGLCFLSFEIELQHEAALFLWDPFLEWDRSG